MQSILDFLIRRWGFDIIVLMVIGWLVWNVVLIKWSIFGEPWLKKYEHLQDGSIFHRLDRIEEELEKLNKKEE